MNNKHNIDTENKSRRAFLQQMTAVLGATAAASVLSLGAVQHALAFVPNPKADLSQGKVFSEQQLRLLKAVVDVILPQTDTPSASELDCHGFIDHQLFHCYTKAQQQAAVELINTIDKASKGKFDALSASQQQKILNNIESQNGFSKSTQAQFSQLKALLVFAYFTTEIGATQALAYQAVPGSFKGSIKINEKTKAWGSINIF